jgi:hypothetical protein
VPLCAEVLYSQEVAASALVSNRLVDTILVPFSCVLTQARLASQPCEHKDDGGQKTGNACDHPAEFVHLSASACFHTESTARPTPFNVMRDWSLYLPTSLQQNLDHDYPDLAHHNIFFSPDYPAEFGAIFDLYVPVMLFQPFINI